MAQDTNQIILVGRLTKAMKVSYRGYNNFAVSEFSIAVNDRFKKGDEWVEEASFFACKLLGKRAEGLANYMGKGQQVAIQGKLKQERWQNDDGPQQRIVIEVQNVQLLSKPQGSYNNQASEMFESEDSSGFNEDTAF